MGNTNHNSGSVRNHHGCIKIGKDKVAYLARPHHNLSRGDRSWRIGNIKTIGEIIIFISEKFHFNSAVNGLYPKLNSFKGNRCSNALLIQDILSVPLSVASWASNSSKLREQYLVGILGKDNFYFRRLGLNMRNQKSGRYKCKDKL